jgi:phospholipid/cholesterol/gamma-HCH transport system substrate-binding protein
MRSFRDRNPYAVGLVSIAVIGLLVGLAFAVGLLHLLEDTYEMRGEFTDSAGIRGGDDVKLAGVKVGRVTKIETDRDKGLVLVTWVVDDGVELGPDTRAEIALETLLGSKFIRLSGPVEEPFISDLPSERRLVPVERTSTPVDVFDLTRDATRQIEATNTDQLNDLVNQLAEVTDGKKGAIADLVTGIDRVASALNERDQELRSLLSNAGELSALLAEKDETLVQLIDASHRILDLIVARRDALAQALGDGANAVDGLSRVLIEHKADIDRILDTLHPTLGVVDANQAAVDTALAYLGPGFFNQTAAGTQGPWLDVYIRSLGPSVPLVVADALDQLEGPPP